VCCGVRDEATYTAVECRATCPNAATQIQCSNSANCDSGQVCCGVLAEGSTTVYALLSCRESCGGYVLCASNDDCTGGAQCQNSLYLPDGFRICR
jgi:hypothetical protein